MTIRTKQELLDQVESEWPDNTRALISRTDMNGIYIDLLDSLEDSMTNRSATVPATQSTLVAGVNQWMNETTFLTQDILRTQHLGIVNTYADSIITQSGSIDGVEILRDSATVALDTNAVVRPLNLRWLMRQVINTIWGWMDTLGPE